ncbi:MAG: biopolymer transporter ExbD [Opitutales bacterium]|nr:biopolymer transporter ExbD [Opitutales bacterium]
MSKRRSAIEEEAESDEINISPLIDMVFILLIFFIVTTVFVEETGVDVNKPEAASAIDLEKNSVLLAITENGQVVYGGREIGVNGVRSIVRRLTQRDNIPVIIQADKAVSVDLLMRVYDEAKLAGANEINVSTE